MKEDYFILIYLAAYYRWSAFRSAQVGSRSPVDGHVYGLGDYLHKRPHVAGCIAMAKEYLKIARQLREQMRGKKFTGGYSCLRERFPADFKFR
jgi:hypothetical protein